MRRKLIKWIIVTTVLVTVVFIVFWFANRGDADEARQACLDYVADQTAVGKPVSHAELLALWRESEGKNLLEEPEISAYIDASPPMSSLKKDDPLTMAAVDRLLLGMQDCETVSMASHGVEIAEKDGIYLPKGVALKGLTDAAASEATERARNGDVAPLIALHEIEAKRSPHLCGFYELTIKILIMATLGANETAQVLATDSDQFTANDLQQLLDLTNQWSLFEGWHHILLYERGMLYSSMDSIADPSSLPAHHLHHRYKHRESSYLSFLIYWKALEDAAIIPAQGWNLKTVRQSILVFERSSRGHSLPNPLHEKIWEGVTEGFVINARAFTDGFEPQLVLLSAYRGLVAAHLHQRMNGAFPSSIEDLPDEYLSPVEKQRLAGVNAGFVMDADVFRISFDDRDDERSFLPQK